MCSAREVWFGCENLTSQMGPAATSRCFITWGTTSWRPSSLATHYAAQTLFDGWLEVPLEWRSPSLGQKHPTLALRALASDGASPWGAFGGAALASRPLTWGHIRLRRPLSRSARRSRSGLPEALAHPIAALAYAVLCSCRPDVPARAEFSHRRRQHVGVAHLIVQAGP
eukprot:scaffold44193_cov76-Phaeocystis_antarctica.AAC.3